MSRRELVIVGAGPAGMNAALAAAASGMRPTVIDDQPRAGGQIYRQAPVELTSDRPPLVRAQASHGLELKQRFRDLGEAVERRSATRVWGLFPSGSKQVDGGCLRLGLQGPDGVAMLDADQVILAPGAYEYLPPFPGWTLPGVMTPGAAQALTKTYQVAPGKRVVVAGSGPFLLVVAAGLAAAGVDVLCVLEAARRRDVFREAAGLLTGTGLLAEGWRYLKRLNRAGVPLRWGHLVTRAAAAASASRGVAGSAGLAEVTFAPCDAEWRPDSGREQTVAADALCIAYGFVSRVELYQSAGCALEFEDVRGGWVPRTDAAGRTSVPGVLAAGDGSGVAGAVVAELEGAVAGLTAALDAGVLTEEEHQRRSAPLRETHAGLRRARGALDNLYRIRPGLSGLAAADTLVCRCEELTLQQLEEGVAHGGCDSRTLKVITRLGMGPCQGRMCWPATARWLASRSGRDLAEIGPARFRTPLQPVTLGELAAADAEP